MVAADFRSTRRAMTDERSPVPSREIPSDPGRREFVCSAAGLLLGGAATGLLGCGRGSEAGRPPFGPVGVQLYTVRSLLEEDFADTIERIAEIGYDHLEFAGYYDRTPDEVGALLDRLNLNTPSAHSGLDVLREDLDREIERARALDQAFVVCPYLSDRDRGGLDAYRALADEFNRIGARCREAGLRFAYHNHDFEFESRDGRILYDVLLERTDPEVVEMELDVYWIVHAGHDPIAYFERYPGRFPLLHVKDRTESGAMASVGEGAIDWPTLFSYADQAGTEYFLVEHDDPDDPLASLDRSHRYLSELEVG